jgi:hypothetical protein
MEDIKLDDLYKDLQDPANEEVNPAPVPGDLDYEQEEEVDHDNLFDLDPSIYFPDGNEDGSTNSEPGTQAHTEESDIIADLLHAKGIADPTAINYENDEGEIEQVNFYELPYEEQLQILQSNDSDLDGLSETESEAVSFLRQNGVSLEEAIDYFQRKAVEDHINSQNISGLEVDQYNDDELYSLHLKSEYPSLTDEEIQIALEKQLEHPDLFKKQVDKLRTDYKEIEAKQLDDSRAQQAQIEEEKRAELEDTLVSVATSVADIGGLTLDDADRNEVLHHILNKDMNGVSPFIKSLNSPQQLFELAWYAVKGKEAFDTIHDYYKKEIANVSKTAFEKGKQAASGQSQPPKQSSQQSSKRSYTRKQGAPSFTAPTPGRDGMSINDIQID